MERPDIEHTNLDSFPDGLRRLKDCYKVLEQIGDGGSCEVYKGKDIKTGEIVALKAVQLKNERIPKCVKREVDVLKILHHENIVQLKEIVSSPDGNLSKGSLYMVFEYMDHDMLGLMLNEEVKFTVPQIKCYMKQLLAGLHYCHSSGVMHRDLKADNLLIDNEGKLKIADFGLAKGNIYKDLKISDFGLTLPSDSEEVLTTGVPALWYRSPELLLGSCYYDPAVDIWSVGVVFAQLLRGVGLVQEETETEQLNELYELFGSIDESNWPGVSKLPLYDTLKPERKMESCFKKEFKNYDQQCVMLLERMLTPDPSQRISAKDALEDDCFLTDPLPSDPKSIPKYESSLYYLLNKRNEEAKRQREETSTQQRTPSPSKKRRTS